MTEKTPLFDKIPAESQKILNTFDSILQDVKPLNSKQQAMLPQNIRNLSHLLTDDRNARRIGYMNETVSLSAYAHYFLWWNLVRLTPLFAGLAKNADSKPFFDSVQDGDVFLDIGSGPLTVPIALWLAAPALRQKEITFYCLDYSQTALSFGEELLLSIMAKTHSATPDQKIWKIIRVKGSLGTKINRKARLVTCANMFNELFWNSSEPLEQTSKKYASVILGYACKDAAVFVAEPGIPRAARFISLLKDSLMRKKFLPVSPCPHFGACPMDGRKGGKWCHFVLLTDDAPEKLLKLSAAAGIPKDRASLSFVFSASENYAPNAETTKDLPLRIVSDSIRLYDGSSARYACSARGLTLAIAPETDYSSGDFVRVNGEDIKKLPVDRKSGAVKITLK